MKTTRTLLVLTAITLAIPLTSAQGNWVHALGGLRGFDFSDFGRRVQSRDEVEKLPRGTKVAMACKECRMLNVRDVSDKERVLSWFAPQVQHKCPGCAGRMTLKTPAATKKTKHAPYTHVCSKCGDNSTFICAQDKPKR